MDSSIITDPRFKLLGKRLGISWREAVGSCFLLWTACYERRSKKLTKAEADASAEIEGFAAALIEVGLAHDDDRDKIVIHGVDARIKFLKEQQARGSNGGRNSRKSASGKQVTTEANAKRTLKRSLRGNTANAKQTLEGKCADAQAYSPAPSPALTPSPAHALSEKEEGETATREFEDSNQKPPPEPPMVHPDEIVLATADRAAAWDQFVFAYPNQSTRDEAARLAWDMLPLTAKLRDAIMTGLSRWRRSGRWNAAKYIPDAKNFIGRRQWERDPPSDESNPSTIPMTQAPKTREDYTRELMATRARFGRGQAGEA
jgi:hypothetical protein